MKTDIEIANSICGKDIGEIAAQIGLAEADIERYGNLKAKIHKIPNTGRQGKLILVTAINPTPAGEGKTTVTTSVWRMHCVALGKTA